MRSLAVAVWLGVGAAAISPIGAVAKHHVVAAPAPMIGSGAPAVLVIAGVMLGAMFLRRRRQS